MDYKDTLLLPKTDFEMRGNLNKKEPLIQQQWDEENLYEAMLKVREEEGAPLFVLHDGPPYANGNIHLGHALNGIQKDLLVRTKHMAGFRTPFRPGWDTHGLPIETAIQKLGVDRKSIPLHEFRALCEKYAREQVAIQMKDFKSLGKIGDYKNPYITLNKDYEATQIRVFAQMALKGMIYKGLKPVYWSPSSETALAEAEIEYYDRKDPAIFIAFDVVDGKGVLDAGDRLVIWTTTPWTIPANLAISVNANMEYVLVKTAKGNLVLMKSLMENALKELELENEGILKSFMGSEIEYVTYKHPLYDRVSPVLNGDHVTDEAGTGCVHTAPDHGAEDFDVCAKYGIKPIGPVDAQGHLNEKTGEFAGMFFEKANKEVTLRLEEEQALLKMGWITHSYAHDWRTKKPIIYRATTQWFASIDGIRQQILDEIASVTWYPAWGEKRMHNMIADRGDWTISRQRAWGVPIPIFYAEDGTPIIDAKVFDHVADLFDEFGSNIWFEKEAKDLLPDGYTHPNSPNGEFTKEKDIMDVWFDSGSSHTAALNHKETPLPVDAYAEGADQYRGWFNSSLIISVALYGIAPYKNVITHGFIKLDGGEKMSKSKSNGLSPNEITSTLGADILRLWVASVDYHSDITMSQDLLKQVSESYRKIRNTFRFMHGNLADFDIERDGIAIEELSLLNRYVLNDAVRINAEAQKSYAQYDYQKATTAVLNSLINTMSSYYLDYTKDILYIEKSDARSRREIQTVIYHTLDIFLKLLSPILVHTSEEMYAIFKPNQGSIHLTKFVAPQDEIVSVQEKADMNELFKLRESVFKALEEKRAEKTIGKSLEAEVHLNLESGFGDKVQAILGEHLAQWFIVSDVKFTNEDLPEVSGYRVGVQKTEGHTCSRCWNVVTTVNTDGLCPRCESVLKG
ncbi:isoleucine--tRNA ligase [Erysipelothrix sp. HDW6C]|uniref:isoleucine--tRNA ligase n=1 Tax=Erysipelothrix sp. HDW6C TaxID=2714930 RepID=UPI0014098878|nr:isoleucine--tRNA ligase [Erysipelothrix sp. HDW6C]QIK69909.1 isoleucine--tRNA ligase [Erysipelothrix sp. HDW6C]